MRNKKFFAFFASKELCSAIIIFGSVYNIDELNYYAVII